MTATDHAVELVVAGARAASDKKGEQIACPDQAQQLEDAKRFLPKDCTAAGCEAE